MDISELLTAALRDDPERIGLEFDGHAIDCAAMAAFIDSLQALLSEKGVPNDAPIALLARNRPSQAIALLGLVEAGRQVSNVYAFQSPDAIAADIEKSGFRVIVAEDRDWTEPVIAAARKVGSLGISLSFGSSQPVSLVPGLEQSGPGPFRAPFEEAGLEILSSGTTGPPKRIAISNRILVRTLQSLIEGGGSAGNMAPDLVIWPIAGVGGASCLIGDFALKRTIVLLEKFELEKWLDALQRHQIPATNVPPTVLRMVLDAKVPREALSSLKYIFGGAAALDPDLQDEFEATYDIPLIWAYGATEFCGTLTSWTPDLYANFKTSKRGSIGKPIRGTEIRIVDPHSGEELPQGETGLVEARAVEIGPEWVRTTDLAYIDEDGFLFHQGRADGAITRGGFKILPELIDNVLREHPAVFDAATVGLDDRRLGQVPASVVQLAKGAQAPDTSELFDLLSARLGKQYVTTQIRFIDEIPRTTSLKPRLADLRAMFAELEEG